MSHYEIHLDTSKPDEPTLCIRHKDWVDRWNYHARVHSIEVTAEWHWYAEGVTAPTYIARLLPTYTMLPSDFTRVSKSFRPMAYSFKDMDERNEFVDQCLHALEWDKMVGR